MIEKFLNGDIASAISMQLSALPLIDTLFSEVNPIPIKSALNYMGYNYGSPRLPLIDLNKEHSEILKTEMERYGLL